METPDREQTMWFKRGFGGSCCGPETAQEAVREAFDAVRDAFGDTEVEHALPVDVVETEDGGYLVRASLPGFRREDVNVELTDNVLRISGNRKEEGSENAKYLVRERGQGAFARRVKLRDASEDGVKAELKDGVLTVRVAKATPQPKSVPIE